MDAMTAWKWDWVSDSAWKRAGWLLALGVVLSAGSGCTDGSEPSPYLIDSEEEEEEIDEELAYLRSLQAVRYQVLPTEGCLEAEFFGTLAGGISENVYFSSDCASVSETSLDSCGSNDAPSPCLEPEVVDLEYFLDPGTADPLIAGISGWCSDQVLFEGCPPFGGGNPCAAQSCQVVRDVCTAHTLLELTGARDAPFTFEYDPPIGETEFSITVPAQSTATAAALAEVATVFAARATSDTAEMLANVVEDVGCDQIEALETPAPFDEDLLVPAGVQGRSFAEIFSSTFVEAYQLHREAKEVAAQKTVDFAEKFRSNPNADLARERQIGGPILSRGHGARLLLGGQDDAVATLAQNFCTASELSGGGRRALEIIRASGIGPGLVESIPGQSGTPVDIEEFLHGANSVRAALVALHEIADDVDLPTAFGLRVQDFEAARAYLAQEYAAFGRDKAAFALPSSFLATKNPPRTPSPAFYATLLSGNNATYPLSIEGEIDFSFGLAEFSDRALSSAASVAFAELDPPFDTSIQNPLLFLIESERTDLQGRWTVELLNLAQISSKVHANEPFEGLVLRGERGLSCAVAGHIEGASCALFDDVSGFNTDLVIIPAEPISNVLSEPTLFPVESGFDSSEPVLELDNVPRLYLARAKEGVANPGPGDYDAVAGMEIPLEEFPRTVPITPDLYDRAGRLLTPSIRWCTRPFEECGESLFDVRVALEDELTEDNDGVESSWKYYLALARQAAAESDLLANEYIQAGLELDRREEELELREAAAETAARNELETLQNVCGATIDLQKILDALDANLEGNDLDAMVVPPMACLPGESCACTTDADCDADYECRQGKCVASVERIIQRLAVEDPEMRRVADCMFSGANLSAVTLGNRPICFTRPVNQPNQICLDDAGAAVDGCPAAVNPGADCPDALPERTVAQLGLFSEETGDGLAASGDEILRLCQQIRNLPEQTEPDVGFLNTGQHRWLYSEENLKAIANSITYEDEPGNYARVLLNRGVWFTTGTSLEAVDRQGSWLHPRPAIEGTDPDGQDWEWPCDGTEHRECGHGDGPGWRQSGESDRRLFCSVVAGQCTDQAERARFNRRVRDAIAFLRFSLGLDASNIEMGGLVNDASLDDLRGEGVLHPFPPPETMRPLEKKVWAKGDDPDATTYLPHPDIWFSAAFDEQHTLLPCNPWGLGPCITIQRAQFSDALGTVIEDDDLSALRVKLWWQLASDWWYPEEGYHDHIRATIKEAIENKLPRTEGVFEPPSYTTNVPSGVLVKDGGRFGDLRLEGIYSASATGNVIGSQPFVPTFGTAYDAMELVCEANAHLRGRGGIDRGCVDASVEDIQVTSVEDLSDVASHVGCMASALETIAARTLLFNFPRAAVDALKQQSAVGSYPGLGGEFGRQVAAIRAALIELHDKGPKIASEVNQLRYDIDELKAVLELEEIRREIEDKQFWKEASQQMTNCATSVLNATDGARNLLGAGAPALAAAATCVNSALQINLSAEINELAKEGSLLQDNLAVINFRRNFENRAAALRDLGTSITTAQENLDSALAALENQQKAALRSLENAIWLSTNQASQQYNINSVMRRRFNTGRVRYERAHEHAKQMARLAKRAIESRLGERLSNMVEDLPLVGAPSEWEADVCATAPVDYLALREPISDVEETSGLSEQASTPNYADSFIGEYVRRLESVVESYRQVNNFHEGTDVAVISLRDDIMQVRKECPSSSVNAVPNSAALDDQWAVSGCEQLGNCVSVDELGEPPFDPEDDDEEEVSGYRVTFGAAPTVAGEIINCDDVAGCGVTADTRLAVPVGLGPGDHLLTWYARRVEGPSPGHDANPDGCGSVRVFAPDGSPLELQAGAPIECINGWARCTALFTVSGQVFDAVQDAFFVAVVPDAVAPTPETSHQVDIAAVQIEGAVAAVEGDPIGLGIEAPLPFEGTNAAAQQSSKRCQDTDGSTFRSTRWTRDCIRLCDEGFTGECDEGDAREFCYREASFSVSQREIEQGTLFRSSGFAYGNFNYRIESVGLNFVGSDVRNCSESETPQSCYGGGFMQYSLRHEGPYFVRNFDGNDVQIELFTGQIEHARGLATERYITNPLSDADRSLLEPYVRAEFQGRPLDGSFVLRVWEDQNARFDEIQDVQLVLNYRYWTRFN